MTEYAPRHCGIFLGNKSGALELRKVESGGYMEGNDDDAAELLKDMLEAKQPVSQWAIWDNRSDGPTTRQNKPYTAKDFATLTRGEDFALVWCKRGQFRAPVLKIGVIDAKANNTGKRAAPTRFGK